MIKEENAYSTAKIKELLSQYRAMAYIVNHTREDLLLSERRAADLREVRFIKALFLKASQGIQMFLHSFILAPIW